MKIDGPVIQIQMGKEVLYTDILLSNSLLLCEGGQSLEKALLNTDKRPPLETANKSFGLMLCYYLNEIQEKLKQKPSMDVKVNFELPDTKYIINFGMDVYEGDCRKDNIFHQFIEIYKKYYIPELKADTFKQLLNDGINAIADKRYDAAYYAFNKLYYWSSEKLEPVDVYRVYALNGLAFIHFINDRTGRAVENLKLADTICRDNDFHNPDVKFQVYSNLGSALLAVRRYEEALTEFHSARNIGENSSNMEYTFYSIYYEGVSYLGAKKFYNAGVSFEQLSAALQNIDGCNESIVQNLTYLCAMCFKKSAEEYKQQLDQAVLDKQLKQTHSALVKMINKVLPVAFSLGKTAFEFWLCTRNSIKIEVAEKVLIAERVLVNEHKN